MRRAIIVGLMVLAIMGIVYAQTWYPVDSRVVGWTPVTLLADGNPIPPDNVIKYDVYVKHEITGVETKLTPQPILETEYSVTLAEEGKYWVGILALRYGPEGDYRASSEISWTNDPLVVPNGETWGLTMWWSPANVGGIAPK